MSIEFIQWVKDLAEVLFWGSFVIVLAWGFISLIDKVSDVEVNRCK